MPSPVDVLATITSNPQRIEELRQGVAGAARRSGRLIRLQIETETPRIRRALAEAQVLLTYRFSPGDLAAAKRLRWIHFGAAGVDHSLFPDLLTSEIHLTTSKGMHGDVMAEYAVMGILALACGLPLLMDAQRRRSWEGKAVRPLHHSVRGRRLLVLGLGHTGRAAAGLAASLGLRVRGIRRRPLAAGESLPTGVEEIGGADDLDRMLPHADYLLLALPRTPQTEGLLDRRRLRLLPAGAGVINMARGGLLDERALLDLLDRGHLRGAVLDCFHKEPLPASSPLWNHPGVIVTPHMSGNFDAYTARVIEQFLENLDRWLTDRALRYPLDREAGY
jgi:phosphoglycerate dehydrogenase-like enzyme